MYSEEERRKRASESQARALARKSPAEREQIRAYARKYKEEHRDEMREYQRTRRKEIRKEVLAAYGNRCQCPGGCQEIEPLFLTIDHVLGDGYRERSDYYQRIKKEGFPKDKYRVLCFNCNCGRALNGGACPHEKGK